MESLQLADIRFYQSASFDFHVEPNCRFELWNVEFEVDTMSISGEL